jgi:hypothetical protein
LSVHLPKAQISDLRRGSFWAALSFSERDF